MTVLLIALFMAALFYISIVWGSILVYKDAKQNNENAGLWLGLSIGLGLFFGIHFVVIAVYYFNRRKMLTGALWIGIPVLYFIILIVLYFISHFSSVYYYCIYPLFQLI